MILHRFDSRLNRGDVIGRSSATGAADTGATVKKEVKQEPSSDAASPPPPKPTSETGAIPKSIKKVRCLFCPGGVESMPPTLCLTVTNSIVGCTLLSAVLTTRLVYSACLL